MKRRPFVILMAALAVMLLMTIVAVVKTLTPKAPVQKEILSTAPAQQVHAGELDAPEDGVIRWQDPYVEVGTLSYTLTDARVVTNVNEAGPGGIREGATLYLYGSDPEQPVIYYDVGTLDSETGFIDGEGNLVEGGSLVLLDILVESVDAVNFRTNPVTGVQKRRYADDPFLFRADEICYLIDTSEDSRHGYTYFDAVYFSDPGRYAEHPMAYQLLPGESRTIRIGFLLGNRKDGTPMDHSDLVISTMWNEKEEKYFDLELN